MLVSKSSLSPNVERDVGTIYCFSDITAIRDVERERRETLEFLSHDMRSPQAAIVSLVDGQVRSNATQTDILLRIRNHATQTLKLTEDFVQLARLETVALRMEEHNLVELMREAIDENFAQAKATSIIITSEAPLECHYALVDGAMVVRAFSNLIGNAIKYSPTGSIVACRIWTETPDRIICEIADKGPGLPQQRLNDPFVRFGFRDERESVGAGLGLAFVKRSIDRNIAEIECYSNAADGTRFVISFKTVDDVMGD